MRVFVLVVLTIPSAVGTLPTNLPRAQSVPSAIVVPDQPVWVSSDLPGVPHIEPHLAIDPTDPDHLVAAVATVAERTTISALTSFDGGRTWSRSPLARCWLDPWVDIANEGTVRVSCIENADPPALLFHQSDDGGQTWSPPTEAPLALGSWDAQPAAVSASGYDHASFSHRAAGSAALYAVAMQALTTQDGEAFAGPVFLESEDGGRSFGEPRRFVNSNVWANALNVLALPDGAVGFGYMDFGFDTPAGTRPLRARRIWWVSSTDGGETFRLPNLVAEVEGATTLPLLAADTSTSAGGGRLYLAVDEIREGEPGVYVYASADGGRSWRSSPRVASDERGPFANPAAAVSDDGVVGVAWYDGRNGASEACWDLYFTASTDAGATFMPEVRLTSEASCSRVPGNVVGRDGRGSFDVARRWPAGGDYFGIVGGAEGSFDLLWSDSRTGVYQLWLTRVRVEAPSAHTPASRIPSPTLDRKRGNQR
jgi:photosystem II stability/assembly factor-like uncharacterized protein